MFTGKPSNLLALILLHSNKLEAVFKKTKQAVSLSLTTQNEIAHSFYLTFYTGGDCLETLGRSTGLKKGVLYSRYERKGAGDPPRLLQG